MTVLLLRCVRVETINDYLRREIDLGSFPGAAWIVGTHERVIASDALGLAVAVPLRIPARLDTIWDCASITKPLVTTVLALQGVAEGKFALDDAVPELPWRVTYRQLLSHSSGLVAWLPMYAFPDRIAAIVERGRECEPGTRVTYSDLNFALLHRAIEREFGDFIRAANERVLAPLGISESAMFNPPKQLMPRIAATEWAQRIEKGMTLDRKLTFDGFRTGLMWGEPNDGNSYHHGGSVGTAGLFGTVEAVYRLARAWANAELLPRELVDEATRNQTEGLGDARGLGWHLADGTDSADALSRRAYGHTGFTGTSVWIDPEKDRILVLLTNRVHPCAAPIPMQKIRGRFAELGLEVTGSPGHRGTGR